MKFNFKVGRAIKKLGKIRSNLKPQSLGMMVDIAESFEENLKQEAPKWKGYLKRSIKTTVTSDKSVNVKMAGYGFEVDAGHELTPSNEGKKLYDWAKTKEPPKTTNWYWYAYKNEGFYWTKPNNFISRAWRFTKDEIPQIVKKRVNKMVK